MILDPRHWVSRDVHPFYVRVFVPVWIGSTIAAVLLGWRL